MFQEAVSKCAAAVKFQYFLIRTCSMTLQTAALKCFVSAHRTLVMLENKITVQRSCAAIILTPDSVRVCPRRELLRWEERSSRKLVERSGRGWNKRVEGSETVVLLICVNGKHMVNNCTYNFYIIVSHNVCMQHDMIEVVGRVLGNETSLQIQGWLTLLGPLIAWTQVGGK